MIWAAALLAAAPAPTPASDPGAEPASVIAAERAFAADAQKLGQWTAFAKWADPKGVLVNKQAVSVADFTKGRADPPSALRWWPVRSFQSCDGATAVNLGGWDGEGGAAGQFHTVWRRAGGRWRYLVDIGAGGRTALADSGVVEIVTASCGAPAAPALPAGDSRHGQVVSADGSLSAQWAVPGDGTKRLTVKLWDGARMRTAYDAVMAQ